MANDTLFIKHIHTKIAALTIEEQFISEKW